MLALLYRSALRLYPARHNEQFGEEMMAVFRELLAEAAAKGGISQTRLCLRETAGVVAGAMLEQFRGLGGDNWEIFSNRRFNMRASEFRFPRATAILMTLILAGILMAIKEGEAIQRSLPHVNPPIGPIHSVHSTLLSGAVLGFAFFCAASIIGWAIFFAMRRSGVHRLDETPAK
jgi:hypothetical protein